ncbi:hypothetical protein HOLleu_30135 [Holothuria leucospilota]|uniref:Uncharacterized protein n=1 Tax=Holothuria leucospilota TaxID=206669 RepID=A0A9Q1BK12_HOLLE|nr:hypothetical protein HOLleu_30135 [Holothuria leucospilota]
MMVKDLLNQLLKYSDVGDRAGDRTIIHPFPHWPMRYRALQRDTKYFCSSHLQPKLYRYSCWEKAKVRLL